jgi:hypothetical protein
VLTLSINMRLLQLHHDGNFSFAHYSSDVQPPKYAILSHTWGEDNQEITFSDIKANTGREKTGYAKLHFCGKQVLRDDLKYFWVDTCCIDKSNSTELTKAINSMFRWYENAEVCYVFLSDVSSRNRGGASNQQWLQQLKRSRWFTRGWTLQELLAPKSVQFFSIEGNCLGDKHSLVQYIHDVTGISIMALEGRPLFQFDTEEKMSWASERLTKEGEDAAYCLMGLFDIHMPLIYGEGREKAVKRLRTEIHSSMYLPSFQKGRGRKQRTHVKSQRTLSNMDSRLPFQTHRDSSRRHLIRFHEALVLLHTLRGLSYEQENAECHIEGDILSLPLKTSRRKFLTDVAYICDYDCEGRTATAIALEVTQHGSVFWVASSSSPEKMIIAFTKSLLAKISHNSDPKESSSSIAARDTFEMCIEFAKPHIEACRRVLLTLLERGLNGLDKNIRNEGKPTEPMSESRREIYEQSLTMLQLAPDLVEWLKSWAQQDSPAALCHFAYITSGSTSMRTIARISASSSQGTEDRVQHPFELCIYYIQRLRRYHLAAATILMSGQRLPELRNKYRVEGVTTPPGAELPPFDISTNIESIATRLHPANSLDLNRRQQTLREMESSDQIFQHFQKNYISPRVKPHVHPEVQMLEWFHAADRLFAAGDPFVACSKPSCLSCQLYFRYHAGYFVEPFSDRKICLSWRPHELDTERNFPMSDQQQKTLMNSMISSIRKEALRRIDERSMLTEKRPKLVPQLGKDDDLPPAGKLYSQARSCAVPTITSPDLIPGYFGNGGASMTSAPRAVSIMLPPINGVGIANISTDYNCNPRKKLFGQISPDFNDFVNDSDEEGGVLL